MAKTNTDFTNRITYTIQDDASILTPSEIADFLIKSVAQFSKDRPREIVVDKAGNGKYDYAVESSWVDEFSNIIGRIEYPNSGYQEPQYIDDNDWMIYKTTDKTYIRFLHSSPASDYSFRYTYTAPHTLSSETNTIPETDFDGVCDLASSICCLALAAKYSQTEEPTVSADVIDYSRKADDYRNLAADLLAAYNRHIGRGPKEEIEKSGACTFKDLDIVFPWQEDYLVHLKRQR